MSGGRHLCELAQTVNMLILNSYYFWVNQLESFANVGAGPEAA
jgi:hypothetical protein